MALFLVPSPRERSDRAVDNLGGVLSVVLVGALVLGINFAPVPNKTALVLGLFAIAARGARRLLPAPAPGAEPTLRPAGRGATNVLGRGPALG